MTPDQIDSLSGIVAVILVLCAGILWVARRNRRRDLRELGSPRRGVLDDVRAMRERRWKS